MTDTASVTWFDGLTYEQLVYLRKELASPTELPDDLMWWVFTKWAESTNRWDDYTTGAQYRLMTELSKRPSAELWAEFIMAVEEADFDPDVYARMEQAAQGLDVEGDLGHDTQPYWEYDLYPRFKSMWPNFTGDVVPVLKKLTAPVESQSPPPRAATAADIAAAAAPYDADAPYQNDAGQDPAYAKSPADPEHSYDKSPADPPTYSKPDQPSAEPQTVPPLAHVVDVDAFEDTNRAAVKDADVGTQIPYWFAEGYLVAGTTHPRPVYDAMIARNAWGGYITVVRRGARIGRDAGEVTVTGCLDHASFRAHFAELSRKTVTFQ